MKLKRLEDRARKGDRLMVGYCSVCHHMFAVLSHADLDGPAYRAYVCEKCVEKIEERG